jgi:hypothetical protein
MAKKSKQAIAILIIQLLPVVLLIAAFIYQAATREASLGDKIGEQIQLRISNR